MKLTRISALIFPFALSNLFQFGSNSPLLARTINLSQCPKISGSYVQLRVNEHPPLKLTQTGCNIKGTSKYKQFETITGQWINGAFVVNIKRRNPKTGCIASMIGNMYKIERNDKLLIDIYGTDGRCGLSPIYSELSLWSKI